MTATFEPLTWTPDTAEVSFCPSGPRGSVPPPAPRPEASATPTLALPIAIDCVPAEQVAGAIAQVNDELESLREELEALDGDVAVVESKLEQVGVGCAASFALARSVHEFLTGLREEAEDEALALVTAARVEARLLRRSGEQRAMLFEARMEQWRQLVTRLPKSGSQTLSWRAPAVEILVPPRIEAAEPTEVPVLPGIEPVPDVDPAYESLQVVDDDATDDFWADIDALEVRRSRLRHRVSRTVFLRIAAASCVGAAIVVRLI